jgi:hypothetical protein
VKGENGDLLADFHKILNRWKKAESLVPDPNLFEVEIATPKLKRYKSSGSDQIPAELIQAGDEILLRSKIHKLRGLSPQANYTDRATAACRRS